jgi:hypothetical protein
MGIDRMAFAFGGYGVLKYSFSGTGMIFFRAVLELMRSS